MRNQQKLISFGFIINYDLLVSLRSSYRSLRYVVNHSFLETTANRTTSMGILYQSLTTDKYITLTKSMQLKSIL